MKNELERKREYARALLEKEYRKQVNPLAYCTLMKVQKLFHDCVAKIKCIFGGNRCLGGESVIFDPIVGEFSRIDQIESNFHVWAWDGKKATMAHANKPFTKPTDRLYAIKLNNGEVFTASLNHKVLTPRGYHDIWTCLALYGGVLQPTSSDTCPLTHQPNDSHLIGIEKDFQFGCRCDRHFYDGQPLWGQGSDQGVSPSPSDVGKHISSEAFEQTDDSQHIDKHTPAYPLRVLLSSWDVLSQLGGQYADTLSRVFYTSLKLVFRLISPLIRLAPRPIAESFLRLSMFVFGELDSQYFSSASITSCLVITSICYLRRDVKYDFEVPVYNNYILGGAIHHNSGKSECVSKYVIEKCLAKPNQKWWMVSETYQDSVNILQKKVWSLLPKTGMTYCKWNEVTGFTNMKIIFPNGSFIRFLTYAQGREAFQGDDVDGIVNDEEPPYDVYKEQRMRLLDRDGEMLFSMTSLRGMTDLLLEIYDGANQQETQKAPLLNDEELPRIADKNGIKFYFLWTTENHHINQRRVGEEAEFMERQEIKSRLYGIPAGVALRIYPRFNVDVHTIKWEDIPDTQVTLYHVLDPHDRKPWAMQWWAVHKTGKMYCVWEYPFNRNFNDMEYDDKTYEDYDKVIEDIEGTLLDVFGKRVHKRIIDPNFGNSTIKLAIRTQGQSKTTVKQEMARLGYKAGQKGRFWDGIDDLKTGHLSVNKGIHWKEKDGQIVVQPGMFWAEHCTNSQRHMTRYSHGDIVTSSGDVKDSVRPKDTYKDFCFVAGTLIRTSSGQVPIENIRVGDMVETDKGLRAVEASNITGYGCETVRFVFSNGRSLIATPNHKIYLKDKTKKALDLLRYGDIIDVWEDQKHMIGKSVEVGIGNLDHGFSIEKCGKSITERLQKVLLFITKMGISSTMTYRTLKLLLGKSIGGCIHCLKNIENICLKFYKKVQADLLKWQSGIERIKVKSGHPDILKNLTEIERRIFESVGIAENLLRQKCCLTANSVRINASLPIGVNLGLIAKKGTASSVEKSTPATSIPSQKAVQQNVRFLYRIKQNSKEKVYNLTVSDRHRYYANDILVANCDLARYFKMSNPTHVEIKRPSRKEAEKLY